MGRLTETVAHLDRSAEFGTRLAWHLGCDADVIARHADFVAEPRVGDVDPILDLLIPGVRRVAQEVRHAVNFAHLRQFGGGEQGRDLDGERERRVAGIFLPTVLVVRGAWPTTKPDARATIGQNA